LLNTEKNDESYSFGDEVQQNSFTISNNSTLLHQEEKKIVEEVI